MRFPIASNTAIIKIYYNESYVNVVSLFPSLSHSLCFIVLSSLFFSWPCAMIKYLWDKMKWSGWHRHCDVVLGYWEGYLNVSTVILWQSIRSDQIWWESAMMWLISGEHVQCGYTGQRWDWGDEVRGHHVTENGAQFKTHELFTSGIFHLIFPDCSWPWVTKTT